MKKIFKNIWLCSLFAAGASHAAEPAWPTRPVRVLVPFAPGGTTDVIARIIAARMTEITGQQFIVDNRAGAGGNIGTGIVANAAPDGQTILVNSSAFGVNPGLYKSIPYDPFKSFIPITNFAESPNLFSAHPTVPAKTLPDVLKLAGADPKKYSFATPGIGTTPHLAVEMLKYAVKMDLGNIPYNGAGQSVTAHLGGQVALACSALPTPAPHVKAGRLRGLAMGSRARHPSFPDIPTMTEAGYKDQESETMQGLYFPAGTPQHIVKRFHNELVKIARMPETRERVEGLGFQFVMNTPEQFMVQTRSEVEKWTRVIRNAKVQVQ
ncbi:MAG: tripartite tricarboxylate transporter substrate binding protein [Burkholderiales bacterium]